MAQKTITVKQMADYFSRLAKVIPDIPVYLSSDEEGNSYGTIEPFKPKEFSSFSVNYANGKYKSVIIYPWYEGLTDEEVGLLEDDTNETKI